MRQFWNEYLCRELIIVAVDFSFASTWHFLRPYAVTRQVQGDDERSRHLLLSEPRSRLSWAVPHSVILDSSYYISVLFMHSPVHART